MARGAAWLAVRVVGVQECGGGLCGARWVDDGAGSWRTRPVPIGQAWFAARLNVTAPPATRTSGCRLVHGENDGLPGLVVDRYAETLVIKLYTAAWVVHNHGESSDQVGLAESSGGLTIRLTTAKIRGITTPIFSAIS